MSFGGPETTASEQTASICKPLYILMTESSDECNSGILHYPNFLPEVANGTLLGNSYCYEGNQQFHNDNHQSCHCIDGSVYRALQPLNLAMQLPNWVALHV